MLRCDSGRAPRDSSVLRLSRKCSREGHSEDQNRRQPLASCQHEEISVAKGKSRIYPCLAGKDLLRPLNSTFYDGLFIR